jgi:hypothetical protein
MDAAKLQDTVRR